MYIKYVCDHVRASVSGLFKDPSCPVDFCPLKSSFIHSFIHSQQIVQVKWSVNRVNSRRCTAFLWESFGGWVWLSLVCVLWLRLYRDSDRSGKYDCNTWLLFASMLPNNDLSASSNSSVSAKRKENSQYVLMRKLLFPLRKTTRVFLLPHSEDRVILRSFVWIGYQRVTDGQTDGRTDRQTDGIAVGITALCIASNAAAL